LTTEREVTVAVAEAKLTASDVFKSLITVLAKSCLVIEMAVLRDVAAAASVTIMREVTSTLAVASLRRTTGNILAPVFLLIMEEISTLDESTPAAFANANTIFLRVEALLKMTGSTLLNWMPTSTAKVEEEGRVVGSVFVSTAVQAALDVLPAAEVVPEGQFAHTF